MSTFEISKSYGKSRKKARVKQKGGTKDACIHYDLCKACQIAGMNLKACLQLLLILCIQFFLARAPMYFS